MPELNPANHEIGVQARTKVWTASQTGEGCLLNAAEAEAMWLSYLDAIRIMHRNADQRDEILDDFAATAFDLQAARERIAVLEDDLDSAHDAYEESNRLLRSARAQRDAYQAMAEHAQSALDKIAAAAAEYDLREAR